MIHILTVLYCILNWSWSRWLHQSSSFLIFQAILISCSRWNIFIVVHSLISQERGCTLMFAWYSNLMRLIYIINIFFLLFLILLNQLLIAAMFNTVVLSCRSLWMFAFSKDMSLKILECYHYYCHIIKGLSV